MHAPNLVDLTITPDQVIGGQPTKGTVHLNGPAPDSGLGVSLSTSNPAATRATVSACAGQCQLRDVLYHNHTDNGIPGGYD